MFKKSLSVFKNSRGISGITWAMFGIFIFAMLAAPFISFSIIQMQLTDVRKTCQNSLNVYTITSGKQAINSIKSGHDFTLTVEHDRFLNELQRELGIKHKFIAKDANNDEVVLSLNNLKLEYFTNNSLKMKLSYTVIYHFRLMGRELFSYPYDFQIESQYKLKY